MNIRGNSAKDSKYLARIKNAIENDKNHPRHLGVQMQAHHIISGEGMRLSGLGTKIEKYGYDINLLPNLAFIPCTLQGACYLGVQPHRGNHRARVDQDDYTDDMEPEDYHDMVARKVKELDLPLTKECTPGQVRDISTKLDKLSKDILGLIQKKPRQAPLTEIARHFGQGGSGCGGVDNVSKAHGLRPCPTDRNHLFNPSKPDASQGPGQAQEKIRFKMASKFELKAGR